MSKLPISLVVDDGGVINTSFFHDLAHRHELLIPPLFVRAFGAVCRQYGVRGKFSVVPLPCGLGRLDQPDQVNLVPGDNVRSFVAYAREYIIGNFAVAPELLTHFLAWNLQYGGKEPYCEDTFIARLNSNEIARYVALALEILDNVKLTPSGVSSPWATGADNEENYARGIGMAFRQVLNRDECFYFISSRDGFWAPEIKVDTPEAGKVVKLSCNAGDPFWNTANPYEFADAVEQGKAGVDNMLSADGRHGRFRELFEAGRPLVLITHWQSLYSDGRGIGLAALEELLRRVKNVFGSQLEWMDFNELAQWKKTGV